MFRFLLKTFLLVVVLLFGVIIGIQEANHGVYKMKGYHDPRFENQLNVSLDNQYSYNNQDLEEKRQTLEEIQTYNLFSDVGKKIAGLFTNITSQFFNNDT
ncbi:DUF3679 domain-containing protein [Bacillus kwashiorkori]|uniref:DUF3679 domain-containing protein n=1 Tax=Bacillus kwashiorkori TaxID=1522318 RepID=UPI00078139A0|nr:DUF3679 domain-containing protein [Bacillus kwashiorkori]